MTHTKLKFTEATAELLARLLRDTLRRMASKERTDKVITTTTMRTLKLRQIGRMDPPPKPITV